MADELTKALLIEDVVVPRAVGDALYVSVTSGVPLVQALTDAKALTPEMLSRYLSRSETPFLRQVVPVPEIVDRLPPGLCARLFAVPVRRDAITGTIDVVVADASDPHPASEISFHLDAPVRLVRAPVPAIEDALKKIRRPSVPPMSRPPASVRPPGSMRSPPSAPPDERLYDSRPRSDRNLRPDTLPPPPGSVTNPGVFLDHEALRPSRMPAGMSNISSPPPSAAPVPRRGRDTPPWGTPVHNSPARPSGSTSAPPASTLGSEIPIPLTRRTFSVERGGTQRPPPPVAPDSQLGEGIPVDPVGLRAVVELRPEDFERAPVAPPMPPLPPLPAMASFIPGPPPAAGTSSFSAYAPQLPFADIGGIVAAIRNAGSRDEVLELVLTGARMVAFKVALFVVKRGGYLGWAATPEFGDRAALQSILIPLEASSVFDEAVREGIYLGPIRHDEVHAALLHVMRSATRDVALVPIRVTGKTAVIVVADELGDTMLATRRLEELCRAAGESFARIVRMRR